MQIETNANCVEKATTAKERAEKREAQIEIRFILHDIKTENGFSRTKFSMNGEK